MSEDKVEKKINIILSHAPHIKAEPTVRSIMLTVCLALLPATVFSVISFGVPALLTIIITLAATLAFEALWQWMIKKPNTLDDCSACVAGLLLALNLPPSAPWWMCIIGGLFAMIIVKGIFGGLGHNPFNPALAARVFLLISFPQLMTSWSNSGLDAQSSIGVDTMSGATPLALMKELGAVPDVTLSTIMGKAADVLTLSGIGEAGSLGETSAILLLIGGIFLIWRKIITWHIPVFFLGTMAVIAGITHLVNPEIYAGPVFHLGAGGAMLGAFFMATDYSSSPMYHKGQIVFAIGCGVLSMAIRLWGGYPEGVSFAILIMNACVPLLDRWFRSPTEAKLADKLAAKTA